MTKKTENPPEAKIPPPEGLSERSKHIWEAHVPFRVRSAARLMLLQNGLESFDEIGVLKEKLNQEGWTVTTGKSGVIHINPLCRILRDREAYVLKIFRMLGLTIETTTLKDWMEPWQ